MPCYNCFLQNMMLLKNTVGIHVKIVNVIQKDV